MKSKKLGETQIKAAKPTEKPYKLRDERGCIWGLVTPARRQAAAPPVPAPDEASAAYEMRVPEPVKLAAELEAAAPWRRQRDDLLSKPPLN